MGAGRDLPAMTEGLLPRRQPVDEPERDTRVVTLGTDEAADVCHLLSTDTAPDVLDHLDGEPATTSDVAEALDTSLQNADYHIGRLREAGLVRVVGTWLSSRGTEMDVYAPAHDRVVVATASGRSRAGAAGRSGEDPPERRPFAAAGGG